jgi:hypothetical protein
MRICALNRVQAARSNNMTFLRNKTKCQFSELPYQITGENMEVEFSITDLIISLSPPQTLFFMEE